MRKFIDEVQINVKAGDGGHGCLSFHRGPNKPKGGPDGGDGGKGGDVYFVADPQLSSLLDFKYQRQFKAVRGEDGSGKNQTGRSAEDLIVRVPVGCVLRDLKSSWSIDLSENFQKEMICQGGKGGRGNWSFRSSTNQAPREFEKGGEGEERELHLELKSLCDIGLVGLPNAGKSSLLRQLTSATPEVAPYPFTTLKPQLGVRQAEFSYRIADIPGLISGASENKGLGHQFLRHIQRSRVLLLILALDSSISLQETLELLLNELKAYDPELLSKERVLVINKCDLLAPDSETSDIQRQNWKREIKELEHTHPRVLRISALKGIGIQECDLLCQSLLSTPAKVCYS